MQLSERTGCPRVAAVFMALAVLLAGCGRFGAHVQQPTLTSEPFGRTPDGKVVDVITFRNSAGIEVRVMTYGAVILSIKTPDRTGTIGDIVLGFDDLASYIAKSPYFGAVVGRYGNRIAKGAFTLDGHTYTLAKNDGPNTLHGGVKGFDKVVWTAEPFQEHYGVGVRLSYTSVDGEEGFPGTLRADVAYTLDDNNQLTIDYHATTDKATVVNLTQHSYFNLSAGQAADVLSHRLTLDADRYTPVDATLIPTGELAPVAGTPFDFRTPTPIGSRIDAANEQLTRGHGYDHNWVLTKSGPGLSHAARVEEPVTGRTLDVSTTEPGVQFYTGNFLDGTLTGKGGRTYGRRSALCLETQHFPDSPNHPQFPSTVLRPGEDYRSKTVWTFGVVK
jgi:aldose 1-epimerase